MYLFKKKKLNLREIHHLYLVLKPYFPDQEEKYFIDQIIKTLENMNIEDLKNAMQIIYGNKYKFNQKPQKISLDFVQGIKNSNVFSYTIFIQRIIGK